MRNKLIRLAIITTVLLLIPLIATQFTSEMTWTLSDFIFAGVLIFGSGLVFELVSARMADDIKYKAAVGIAVLAAFLLIWINAAVGIIGNEDNPVNLMYFGVLAIGLIGAFIADFQPIGMSRTLFTMAGAQMLVPTIAFFTIKPDLHVTPGVIGIFGINAAFSVMFIVSALLFRRSPHLAKK